MKRRTFLTLAAGTLVALVAGRGWALRNVPVIPKRPNPDAADALGWIAHKAGRFTLTLPRAEMGQNIATALKQIACTELGTGWETVDLVLMDTGMARVKGTVGSESVMLFAEPLAQACAALREALAGGQNEGEVTVRARPLAELRAFRPGAIAGAPEIEQGRAIVTGAPLYAADMRLPGMVFGRVLRAAAAPERASRPRSWSLDAARAVPGFLGVVEDCGPPIGRAEGLGIVASRPGALDRIAEALAVEWEIEESDDNADVDTLIDIDRQLLLGGPRNAVMSADVAEGIRDVDLRFDVPAAAHGPIEPRAAVAAWQNGRLDLWAGTQDPFYVRDVLARAFSVPEDAVTVHAARIGGAFGGKTIATVELEAAALARAIGRPVKVQWKRSQEFAFGFHRPPSSHRIRVRLASGRITDWDHAQVSSHILFTAAVLPEWMQRGTDLFAGDGGVARGMKAPWRLGRAQARYDLKRLPFHTGPWRGLGAGPNGLAIESAMDAAAHAAGIDPFAFRLAHCDDERLAEVLHALARLVDWREGPQGRQDAATGKRIGRGMAAGIYKEASRAAAVADVAVDADGTVKVTRLWAVHDCGLVINEDQVRAQCEGNLVFSLGMVLSDMLPLDGVRVTAETFADAPIPRMADCPPITVQLVASDAPPAGAGETLIVAGPAAIANAIFAATGRRITRFPIGAGDLA